MKLPMSPRSSISISATSRWPRSKSTTPPSAARSRPACDTPRNERTVDWGEIISNRQVEHAVDDQDGQCRAHEAARHQLLQFEPVVGTRQRRGAAYQRDNGADHQALCRRHEEVVEI